MIHRIVFYFLVLLMFVLNGPSPLQGESILDGYIRQGLENNLDLQNKQFSLRKSLQELNEARGRFWPSLSIEARYSRAGGGREIEFPVGDLLNPAYNAINDTRINTGQTPIPFPTLENEFIPFLREKEHETKLRMVQPLFQPALYYNYKLHQSKTENAQLELGIYKRVLVAEIKTAYYNYMKSLQVVRLLKQTRALLEENIRVSRKLIEQDKVTREVLLRAESEMSEWQQQMEDAGGARNLAASYLNYLLNRPLGASIEADSTRREIFTEPASKDELIRLALQNREEINQLEELVRVSEQAKKLASTRFLPGLNIVADYGFQGDAYRFDNEHDYWMVSGLLQWNLFNGFQDAAKRQQAELDRRNAVLRIDQVKNQIRLQVEEAFSNLQVAVRKVRSARDQLRTAREVYTIVAKKYEQGMAAHIEYLEARNSRTAAEINDIVVRFEYQIKAAQMERVTASRPNNDTGR